VSRVVLVLGFLAATPARRVHPDARSIDTGRLAASVDALVEQAIAAKRPPGVVLLVGRGSEIVYQKAYGHRAVVPGMEPTTLDTILDMASVTRIVATTTSAMILVEEWASTGCPGATTGPRRPPQDPQPT
jgi:CubicO group peptidase (beta-lactamase class C family)